MKQLNVAYIGCGAVVERSHLPSVRRVDGFNVSVLIDSNIDQAKRLQDLYSVRLIGNDFRKYVDHFDVAVVATPSASHYPIGKALLEAGKHVLMEKPLSCNYNEGKELVDLANRHGRVLATSLVRRYLPHFQAFRSLLCSKVIGDLKSFILEEGAVFNWPVQSVSFYNPELSGGGVLLDNGAHLLDALLWWLGDFRSVNYQDDSDGGVEADCRISVELESGVTGVVTMSRMRALNNSIKVYGTNGMLEMDLARGNILLKQDDCEYNIEGRAIGSSGEGDVPFTTLDLFEHQYVAFYEHITQLGYSPSKLPMLVREEESLRAIRMIESCYAVREKSGIVW